MGKPECNPPKSRDPALLGYINQVDAISTVASPLLAGFSLASVIIVNDDAKNFRWPGWAMLALTIAAIMLFAALQCGFMARLYQQDVQEGSERQRLPPQELGKKFPRWWGYRLWAIRAHLCGIVALLLGLSLALPPQSHNGGQGSWRWAACVVAFVACLGELTWIIQTRWAWLKRCLRRKHKNTDPSAATGCLPQNAPHE